MQHEFFDPPSAAKAGTPEPPARQRTIYSVSDLNREVRLLIESGIGNVWVQGELSNLSRPASGHWYFSLKDGEAQLRCCMYRQRNILARFTPREGQLLLARGRVSLYEPRGEFQLQIEHLEDAGLGALQRAFDDLKRKLEAEGLFAAERKRALPTAPRLIGVITSPSGAAIRDILNILGRRFPSARVLVHPVPVQGDAAPRAIVRALDLASARAECDVLILARGGGSLEDLWAFNEESVARAIYRCGIPVVAGIGHEIDFTIADFVADVRAPTPSGAAELVAPDTRHWLHRLAQLHRRFLAGMRRTIGVDGERLQALSQRLSRSARVRLAQQVAHLRSLGHRLQQAHPGIRLAQYDQRLRQLDQRLQRAVRVCVAHQAARLDSAARALQAVSPLATLGRGFAVITRSADGALVTSAEQLSVGEDLDAQLANGSVRARVIERGP
ncbi:MAG TPA: exodeoxyribonuclease VII large subunit [Steroidobacteraceae bacterium]|jgi:exodeoxyribonuclease VII large subunit|nr:exodeoxyribonuclease VII large subunit [Steroidobacteraceae bacterium]